MKSIATNYEQSEFLQPRFALEILEPGGTTIPVRQDYLRLLAQVTIHQVWDGADEITLVFRAWDEFDSDYRVVGERIFEPGTSILFRAGYGNEALHLMGRFTIVEHAPTFSAGDVPMVTVTGHDGLALLMDNTWPGDYGGIKEGTLTYTDVARIIALKYGFGLVADVAPRIPHKGKTVRRAQRGSDGKVLRDTTGKKVTTQRKVASRIVKNAGDTDAKMLKDLANYSGFLLPKVRYVEGLNFGLEEDHPVVVGASNRDVLFFRKLSIRRQLSEAETFDFVWNRGGGSPGTLSMFDPTWNTDNTPIGVRVSGVVTETVGFSKSGRPKVRKRIVTVEAQLTDAQALRTRTNLLQRAARENDPTKKAELVGKANAIEPKLTVVSETRTALRKQDKKRFGNAGTALVEVLDKDRRPVREYDRVEQKKVQTMRREVIGHTFVVTDGSELRDIAMGWLAARLQTHMMASAIIENVPRSETLYPNQVHTTSGLPTEYEGPYMIREATHVWSPGNGHTVDLELQRVAEVPTAMFAKERAE